MLEKYYKVTDLTETSRGYYEVSYLVSADRGIIPSNLHGRNCSGSIKKQLAWHKLLNKYYKVTYLIGTSTEILQSNVCVIRY
jgi:hypothetical protein